MENRPIKVLVAPLDWGLGHATRCIPVIRELRQMGTEVLLSAAGGGRAVLSSSFPGSTFIDIPGINITYPRSGSMTIALLAQIPGILKSISCEHNHLSDLIVKHGITHVISDNRYGLYHEKIKTAFVCHQLRIKSSDSLKFMEPLLFRLHKQRIEKFGELWIPDNIPPDNLSGELSDTSGLKIPVRHIGPLSRFTSAIPAAKKTFDFMAMLSGPEPQRSLLEQKLVSFFRVSGRSCLIIHGKPGEPASADEEKIKYKPAISDEEFQMLLHPETTLICRPGYSTLMDLSVTGHRNVLFIPTPGQTEQEYLAMEMKTKYGYAVLNQNDVIPLHDVQPGSRLPDLRNTATLKDTISNFISDSI